MKRNLPPLNALRVFETAARLGRMNAAAEALSVTPGAVSRQVAALEAWLGVSLFEGSKHRPTLTPTAEALLPALTAGFDKIEEALRVAREPQEAAVVNVDCFSTFTVKWLIPRLFDFHAAHPGIEVRLSAQASGGVSAASARADVAIGLEAGAAQDGGEGQTGNSFALFDERLGVVLSPSLAATLGWRGPGDVTLGGEEDVARQLLQTRQRLNAWAMWAEALGVDAPTASGPTFDHYFFTLEAAVQGLGVAVAPWHLVATDVAAGRLVAPLGFVASGQRYVARTQAARSRQTGLFCEWLLAQARGTALPADEALGRGRGQ